MHIQELSLQTRRLADQKAFYHTTLALPILAETTTFFTIQAGTTRLHFQEAPEDELYHIAFTIPRNQFAEAKSWLCARVPLLLRNGEDEIFFANTNACSFYFCDVVGNILEFIVHYDLEQEAEGPFGPASILHVSEIGLPVENVVSLVGLLKEKLGIEPYRGPISEGFAFVGDIYGQLVVVRVGHPWLPTETVLAGVSPVQLKIGGQQEQRLQLSPFPYTIVVAAS